LAWQISLSDTAEKQLSKLDHQVAQRIYSFLSERVAKLDDPRSIGEVLKGSKLGEFWKYRVGDYRIVARIEVLNLFILILRIGHRTHVYER
jgi:mRNA interferase RelE/StbE